MIGIQEQNNVTPEKGRTYIPHGRSKEKTFKPHVQFVDVKYSESGPDWDSSIRCNKNNEKSSDPPENEFYPPMTKLRHFPNNNNTKSNNEYEFYPPHGIPLVFQKGKVTIFNGKHLASELSTREITDVMKFGKKCEVVDPRGNYGEASPGDKPYQAPEYSPGFHKIGSTRPVVTFGGKVDEKANTFIPLQPLPSYSIKPYKNKEQERLKYEEIVTVKNLETWTPALPLKPVLDWKL